MKKESVRNKIRYLYQILDGAEHGLFSFEDVSWVARQVNWLYRYKHITEEEMNDLADKVTNIFENYVMER